MHCRNCGYLASNAITDLCSICDNNLSTAKEWATKKLGGLVNRSKQEMINYLHSGVISEKTYALYHDLWNVSAYHFSVSNSTVRQSEVNLLKQWENRTEGKDNGTK